MNGKSVKFCLTAAIIIACSTFHGAASASNYVQDHQQGMSAMKLKKWDEAVAHFTESVKKNPKFYPAFYDRGLAHSQRGEYDKSIADFKKVVQIKPAFMEAWLRLGVVYEIKKDYASAANAYRQALKHTKKPLMKRELKLWITKMDARSKRK